MMDLAFPPEPLAKDPLRARLPPARCEAALTTIGTSRAPESLTREGIGREHEIHDQCPKVVPIAEWVEGRFGSVSIGVAVAHGNGLA